VGDAHRRVGGVDVLSARARRPVGVDPAVRFPPTRRCASPTTRPGSWWRASRSARSTRTGPPPGTDPAVRFLDLDRDPVVDDRIDPDAGEAGVPPGVGIYPVIDDRITIEIKESDCRIDTYRSSGAGGQHVIFSSSS
jgi:hypothetical protein